MDSRSMETVAKALMEIMPELIGDAIWARKPSLHDLLCARALLNNTLYRVDTLDEEEIVRLTKRAIKLSPVVEAWLNEMLEEHSGYQKLKGFLWLSNQYILSSTNTHH